MSETQIADLIVIPARFGSKRLPGKPLIAIAGRTLLDRVLEVAHRAAALCGNMDVVVATDDPRVALHAAELGSDVVLTDAAISSGSGRVCAAAGLRSDRPEIVVNLQGDAPFVPPNAIARIVETMRGCQAAVATPVVRLDWDALDRLRAHKQVAPFSGTTCVRSANGNAIWFSKSIIPAVRDEQMCRQFDPLSPIYRHLGLYCYRLDALERFETGGPSYYERLEGLEQLRFLEMGMEVMAVEIPSPRHAMSGIDTDHDVALAEALIAEHGEPSLAWT